jgi:hypothetical protein
VVAFQEGEFGGGRGAAESGEERGGARSIAAGEVDVGWVVRGEEGDGFGA